MMKTLDFPFSNVMYGTENEYVIWCLRYVIENSHKIMRCYDKEDDETKLRSYRDDILDIAYYSRKEGKLLRIDFDESLISEYNKDVTRGTFHPMTLKGNVNPWIDMNVIVETIPELCGHEDQTKEVEGYIEETRNTLLTKNSKFRVSFLHMFLSTGLVNPKELTEIE